MLTEAQGVWHVDLGFFHFHWVLHCLTLGEFAEMSTHGKIGSCECIRFRMMNFKLFGKGLITPISSNICFSDDIADVFPPWPFVNIHLNAPLPVIAVKACLAFHTMLVHCVLVFGKMIMMWCNISCVLVNLGLYLPNIRPGNELLCFF